MKETDACERALSLGIHEIAFTNHIMLNQPDYLMSCRPAWCTGSAYRHARNSIRV